MAVDVVPRRTRAWSTRIDLVVDSCPDVVVEHDGASTAERHATLLARFSAVEATAKKGRTLASVVRYVEPALVVAAGIVWLQVLVVTARAIV